METIFDEVGAAEADLAIAADLTEAEQEYVDKVKRLILDAKAYEDDFLSYTRKDNMEYYNGSLPAAPAEGRNSIVSRDAHDTIMAVLPSLIRVFTHADRAVTFTPTTPQAQGMAEEATEYVNYVLWEDNPGFMNLYSVLHDALTKNMGIWKWWTDNNHSTTVKSFSNLTNDQFQMLMMEDPDLDIVQIDMAPDSEDPEAPIIEYMEVRFTESKPLQFVEAIPPEEFRIDRNARNIATARLVGHERVVYATDLMADGYTLEDIEDYLGYQTLYSDEMIERNPGADISNYFDKDQVLFGEFYIRIDQDGDGIDELRRICTIGEDRVIIEDIPVEYAPFAGVTPVPVPHAVIGQSMVEQVSDLQKIRTSLLRAALDSLADTLNPRLVFNPRSTNTDDVLNEEIGALIRTSADPQTAVAELRNSFVGADAMNAYSMMGDMLASRTGISEASRGLDPKALQSTTLSGVDAVITGAQERTELIARIIAETGYKDLFKGLLREIASNPNPDRQVQISGRWQMFQPSTYDPNMSVRVNPLVGKSNDMQRLRTLEMILAKQEQIMSTMGVTGKFVNPMKYRNTLNDMLKLSNMPDVERYFGEVTEEDLNEMAAQPERPTPEETVAQAEVEKVRAQTARTISEKNFKIDKLALDDDFRRDQLNVNAALKLEEIAAREQEARINALNKQDAVRPNLGGSAAS